MTSKTYETPFHEYVKPVYAGACGNCSACAFRTTPKFCEKLACEGEDSDGRYAAVYWVLKNNGGSITDTLALMDWMTKTPDDKAFRVSKTMLDHEIQLHFKQTR